ncbi:endopeptidase La [Mycoplasma sp. 4463]|uniref:endopeptidase La n=2 Tax=unclassified Mycoplasma TaxID=2683645 RepID=UPI003AAADEB0
MMTFNEYIKKAKADKSGYITFFETPDFYSIPGGFMETEVTEKVLVEDLKKNREELLKESGRAVVLYAKPESTDEIVYGNYVKPLEVIYKATTDSFIVVYKVISQFYLPNGFKMLETLPEGVQSHVEYKGFIGSETGEGGAFVDLPATLSKKELREVYDYLQTFSIFAGVGIDLEEDKPQQFADSDFIGLFKTEPLSGRHFTFTSIVDLTNRYFEGRTDRFSEDYASALIATFLNHISPVVVPERLEIFKEPYNRFWYQTYLIQATAKINEILQAETELKGKMTQKLSKQQTEFLLREKLKALQEQIKELNPTASDDEYAQIINSKFKDIFPESVIKLIDAETKKSEEMVPVSPEASIIKSYINTLKKLPWRKVQHELLDINRVREVLDKHHYGLNEIKQRIIEYLAVIIKNNQVKKLDENKIKIDDKFEIDLSLFQNNEETNTFNNVPILTLVGPPGTGKTSLSKAIASALNRKFVKVSLGGVHDESEIRGHRRTYVGAMPGKIIKGMMYAGVSNPVVLLDEIDKMASDMKGDPASAMLEVLDPEQNTRFQDHYLEHEYDLSKCIFIATANYYENIPPALIDRVEVIELSSYTLSEKLSIAREHLIPKVLEQATLAEKYFQISDDVLKYIIQHYTLEAGVRGLKRTLDKIARKIVVKTFDDPSLKEYVITLDKIEELLGVIKFKQEEKEEDVVPGLVTGLAYTSFGGSTLPIEVTTYPGKSEIKLTGSLKEVMQESAQIALTFVRANAEKFGVDEFDFENNTIHIHVPEGAVPKDGPSAGVTFTTAIISALSKRPVPNTIGMTGEITLRGKVLEIGGLKEKSFAASQKGLEMIFIPENNIKNLKDIPFEIKENLTYVPVKTYDEIYNVIFNNQKPSNEIKAK